MAFAARSSLLLGTLFVGTLAERFERGQYHQSLSLDAAAAVEWEPLWCVSQPGKPKGEACKEAVAKQEEACQALYAKLSKLDPIKQKVQYNTLKLEDQGKCDTFAEDRRKCKELAADRERPKVLQAAVKYCEEEVNNVCEKSVCPTYYEAKGEHDLATNTEHCHAQCASAQNKYFETGSIPCPEGEEWAKCLQDFTKARAEATGKDKAAMDMEPLLREHLVKCVCVSARSDASVCYNDADDVGLGISPGKKWCDFYNTPTWRKVLQDGKTDGWASAWAPGHEPTCSENVKRKLQVASHESQKSSAMRLGLCAVWSALMLSLATLVM